MLYINSYWYIRVAYHDNTICTMVRLIRGSHRDSFVRCHMTPAVTSRPCVWKRRSCGSSVNGARNEPRSDTRTLTRKQTPPRPRFRRRLSTGRHVKWLTAALTWESRPCAAARARNRRQAASNVSSSSASSSSVTDSSATGDGESKDKSAGEQLTSFHRQGSVCVCTWV